MAIFSNEDVQNIIKGFDKRGFSVKSLEQNDMNRWTDNELYKDSDFYTEDPNLINKRYRPIEVVNNQNGQTYLIYYYVFPSLNAFQSDVNRALFVDDDGNLQPAEDFQDYFHIVLRKKGNKAIAGEFIDIDTYKSTNEFANFENFDDIDAPNYSNLFADDPQLSVVNPNFDINALTDAQIKKAEEKLKESVKKFEELKSVTADELMTEMWSFDEIDELYNVGITEDDKRAYFLYLQNKTRKKLTGDWDKKYGCSFPAPASYISGLLKRGALFYDSQAKFGERLQPRVIYRSGNIWRKWGNLTNNKEEIIQRFGEEVYQKHYDVLYEIYQEASKNRLSVRSEDKSMRLFLSPISPMAEEITIKEFVNPRDKVSIERNFSIYTTIKDGQVILDTSIKRTDKQNSEKTITQMLNRLKNKFKVDIEELKNKSAYDLERILKWDYNDRDWFEEKGYSESKFTEKSTLSLKEAFLRWCREAGEGQQAQANGVQWGTNIRDVRTLKEYYINPLQKNPFSQEANGKDTFNRYKDEAKKVGERLFAQFLAEGLNVEDQNRVEIIWNAKFNAYVEPDLSQVPIGFTFRKYLDGDTLFKLSEFNLRAIRYYLTRGSVGLAYGVGVGKTFCSIFVIKQALDLGLATRPLIIVPNQVYQQFKFEVFRALGSEFNDALPNSRVNGFFNGMKEYDTIKGNNAVDGINICTYKATELFQFDKNYLDEGAIEEDCLIIESAPTLEGGTFVNDIRNSYNGVLFNEVDQDKSKTPKVEDLDNSQIDEEIDLVDSDTTINEDEDFDLGDTFATGGGVLDKPKIYINTPQTNYDMVVVDEAHNFNNLFEGVEMPPLENQDKLKIARQKNPFSSIRETSGGESSSRSKKLWFIARYVQKINKMGNTILLSATPFTNSPIQVYSLMAILNWDYLEENDMGVIGLFFLNYAKTEYTEDFKTDLTITRRNKLIGWNNVVSLQKYIFRYFDKSTREDEDRLVVRPNKWALPLKRAMIDGSILEFSKDNYISTTIRMSDLQNQIWQRVRDYAKPRGGLPYEDLCSEEWQNTTRWGRYVPPRTNNNEDEVDVENADNLADGSEEGEKAKNTAKAIQCLQWGRQIANNPYVYKCSGFKEDPTPTEYIEQSPKMLYVMECIRSVKEWHEAQTDPQLKKVSGQVIYMDFQPKAFTMLRDYLVEKIGFTLDEIGIISGSGNFIGKKAYSEKQVVADAFLGRKEVGDAHVNLPEEKRVKVLIGSSAIKEGINLQKFGSVLYNCYLDYNPTDRIQVEGRIWRQGNMFKNVRIVTPLMSDSIDIFMFQKLEDKTERINQIWTRNGNVNELDTTAFDPSELKYELLTDPEQIAVLEASNKKDRLNQEKVEKNEVLSQYITLSKIYERAELILNRPVQGYLYDHRLHIYYNICVIRPDLIDKPLLNQEGYVKFAKAFLSEYDTNNGTSYAKDFSLGDYPNIYRFIERFERQMYGDFQISYSVMTPLKKMYIDGMFNYSMQDLIDLMVKVLKEQKIAYPLGYSKNWRDLKTKFIPIVEGDEVEFDSKTGRKKGIAELVRNYEGDLIIEKFWDSEVKEYIFYPDFKDYFAESLKKAGVKTRTITEDSTKLSYDELSKAQKDELITLLKYWYENDTRDFVLDSDDFTIKGIFMPYKLDIGDFENLYVVDRNILKVQKKEDIKKVEPTKYPEPFSWSSKDRDENLLDIFNYTIEVLYPKAKSLSSVDLDYLNVIVGDADRTKFTPVFSDRFSSLDDILLSDCNSSQPYYIKKHRNTLKDNIEQKKRTFPNTWAELISNWKDENGGMFKTSYSEIYDSQYAILLAEFKMAYERKMVPLGITTLTDINNLVTEQRTAINAIDVEINNLDNPQVMQEQVEEVKRRQAILNSDEIRAGSSFKARANLFANSNSDYLGNAMLGLQQKPKDDEKKPVELVKLPVVEEEVIVTDGGTEEGDFETQTRDFIDQLKPLLRIYKGKEKKELQEYINSIEALLLV